MKLFVYLLSLFLCTNAFALIGNTGNGTSTDPIGTTINASRFFASSNMTVDVIKAKVVGSGGKYKCAIYAGSATRPSTFISGSSEVTVPTNGWYSFPLTANVSIINGQNYWLAVWSDRSASAAFYTTTTGGTLRWITTGTYSSTWPSPLTTDGGAAFNYSIYAQDVVMTNTPLSTNRYVSVILAWDSSPTPSVVGYKIYGGIASGNYTNALDVGNVFQTTITNLVQGTRYYFAATAYDSLGFESVFSDEVSYQPPITTNTLSAPVIIRIDLTQ